MKTHLSGLLGGLVFIVTAIAVRAQEGDEVITLSSASRDRGAAYGAVSGGVMGGNTGALDFRQQYRVSNAITLRKRAESVALAITLVNDGRNAETRNKEMLETLSRLLDKAGETAGVRVHNGVLSLSTRDRKLSLLGSFSKSPATHVDLYLLGNLGETDNALEVTNRLKNFLSAVEKVGATRIVEGSVGLSIREPERFRRDLVRAIIDDVHFVTSTLGDQVRIQLNGIDQRISVRQFSDVEVELSIPYGYTLEYARGG